MEDGSLKFFILKMYRSFRARSSFSTNKILQILNSYLQHFCVEGAFLCISYFLIFYFLFLFFIFYNFFVFLYIFTIYKFFRFSYTTLPHFLWSIFWPSSRFKVPCFFMHALSLNKRLNQSLSLRVIPSENDLSCHHEKSILTKILGQVNVAKKLL